MGCRIVADIEGNEAAQQPLYGIVCSYERCCQQEEQTNLPFLRAPIGDCQHQPRYRQDNVPKIEEEVDTENRTEWNHHAPPLPLDVFGVAFFVEVPFFIVEATAFVVEVPAFAV